MAKYELALVVNAKIDREKRVAVVEKAKGYIERFGGTLGATEEWGKKRLAYEIQKMYEGYYYFIRFEAGPDTPNELEANMRILENVLRYLVVRIDDDAEIGEPNETDQNVEEPAEETAEQAAETEEAETETEADGASAEVAAEPEAEAEEAPEENEAETEEAPAEETAEPEAETAEEEAEPEAEAEDSQAEEAEEEVTEPEAEPEEAPEEETTEETSEE